MTLPGTGPVHDDDGEVLDQIRLVGLRATGHHGVFEHERVNGQEFVADVVVHLDTRPAAAGDALARTVHYGELAERVTAVLSSSPADLIETVAERIAAVALAEPAAVAVDVALHKPEAPITVPFEDVVVAVRRSRTRPPVVGVPSEPVAEPVVADAVQAALPPTIPPGDASLPDAVTPPAAVAAPVTPPALPPVALPDDVAATAPEPAEAVAPAETDVPLVAEAAPAPADDDALVAEPADEDDAAYAALRAHDRMDEIPASPVDVVLSLGSNVGDPQQTLRDAISALDAIGGIEVLDVSPLARTAPVGGVEQDDFLNAVVVARTSMSARELLHACQDVEHSFGRVREQRWGPRTLDVDVIVYGALTDVAEDLELPHPRAHERAFVLEPWSQVQPDAVLPGLGGGPVAQLAATAPDRAGIRWLALDWLGDEESAAPGAHAPHADPSASVAPNAEQAPPVAVAPVSAAPEASAPVAPAPVVPVTPAVPPAIPPAVVPADAEQQQAAPDAAPSVPEAMAAPTSAQPAAAAEATLAAQPVPAAQAAPAVQPATSPDLLPEPSSAPTQSTPTHLPVPGSDSQPVAGYQPAEPETGQPALSPQTPSVAPAAPSPTHVVAPTLAVEAPQPAAPPAQPAAPATHDDDPRRPSHGPVDAATSAPAGLFGGPAETAAPGAHQVAAAPFAGGASDPLAVPAADPVVFPPVRHAEVHTEAPRFAPTSAGIVGHVVAPTAVLVDPHEPAAPSVPGLAPFAAPAPLTPAADAQLATAAQQPVAPAPPVAPAEPAGGLLTGVPLSFPPVSGGTRAVEPPRVEQPRIEQLSPEQPREGGPAFFAGAAGAPTFAAPSSPPAPDQVPGFGAPADPARPAAPLFPPTSEEPPTR